MKHLSLTAPVLLFVVAASLHEANSQANNYVNQVDTVEQQPNLQEELEDDLDQVPVDQLPDESASDPIENSDLFFSFDGVPLYEGDMKLTKEQRQNRQAVARLWPEGKVKYTISEESTNDTVVIKQAIRNWEAATCLTFTEVNNSFTGETHLRFIKNGGECSSPVGYLSFKKKDGMKVSIGENCNTTGVVMHEIAHAIGLYHQQSRTDRDNYVRIIFENVKEKRKHNFKLATRSDNHSVPYDLSSLMHYSMYHFTVNKSLPTMFARPIQYSGLMGRRVGATHRDKQIVNTMYKCNSQCQSPLPVCQNGGFVDKSCKCVCPPRITGELCENVPTDYDYYELCGDAHVTKEGKITSPNYPADPPIGGTCFWIITAPKGKKVQLTFEKFKLLYRKKGACPFDKMDIYLTGQDPSDAILCDKEGRNKVYTSVGSKMIVSMKNYRKPAPTWKRKFAASIKFV